MIDIAVKLSWGIIKAVFALLLMPGVLAILVLVGFIKIGLPLILIAGVFMIFRKLLY